MQLVQLLNNCQKNPNTSEVTMVAIKRKTMIEKESVPQCRPLSKRLGICRLKKHLSVFLITYINPSSQALQINNAPKGPFYEQIKPFWNPRRSQNAIYGAGDHDGLYIFAMGFFSLESVLVHHNVKRSSQS